MADGISDNGSIAAASRDAGGNNTLAGFKWQADVMTDLGLYTGHTALRPWGVNSQGKVVGRATNGPGRSNDGVLHDGSGWQLAGWAGGTRGNAFGINESNQVVGNMRLPTNDFSRALIRTPGGGTIELPTLFPDDPGTSTPAHNGFEGGSYATGINAAGAVVGSSGLTDTHGTNRGFIETPGGGMVDLGTPASQGLVGLGDFTVSYAQNLNNAGLILGAADRGLGLTRAVYWDATGQIHDLGTLGGTSGSAYAINEDGVAVTISDDAIGQSRALERDGRALVDLNTVINPASGWSLSRAYAINESGWIVGEGTLNGVTRAVLLTPIPEPAALLLMALAGFLVRRR